LRLHPDTIQRHAPTLAQTNEQALKQLNLFLELATLGCNNDAFNARKHVLALAETRHSAPDTPVRFPLLFHVAVAVTEEEEEREAGFTGFEEVKYTIEVPGRLVKRTLSNPARSAQDRVDPAAALLAPFARDWQRTTKRILQDLFEVAHVPLFAPPLDDTAADGLGKATALADWLAEGDSAADEAERQGLQVEKHNRSQQREHQRFNKLFHSLLTREKNIVHATTTGLEDGPSTWPISRLFLPKFQDPLQKKSVFHWIANLLLLNFMELRLHSLVWNKITLLITADAEVEDPQVSWDEDAPEQGMGILIPVGMDVDTLVDFIYEHVEELEFALAEKSARTQALAKKEHQRRRREKQEQSQGPQSRRRKPHFYADEVAAIFRKS
ncbi:hypothetical protein BBJ28_00025574, partial [Nothophytophthora sp. Chile5]